MALLGFSLVSVFGGYSPVGVYRLLIAVTSVAEHRLSGVQALVVVARGLGSCSSQTLEHGLKSCGTWA